MAQESLSFTPNTDIDLDRYNCMFSSGDDSAPTNHNTCPNESATENADVRFCNSDVNVEQKGFGDLNNQMTLDSQLINKSKAEVSMIVQDSGYQSTSNVFSNSFSNGSQATLSQFHSIQDESWKDTREFQPQSSLQYSSSQSNTSNNSQDRHKFDCDILSSFGYDQSSNHSNGLAISAAGQNESHTNMHILQDDEQTERKNRLADDNNPMLNQISGGFSLQSHFENGNFNKSSSYSSTTCASNNETSAGRHRDLISGRSTDDEFADDQTERKIRLADDNSDRRPADIDHVDESVFEDTCEITPHEEWLTIYDGLGEDEMKFSALMCVSETDIRQFALPFLNKLKEWGFKVFLPRSDLLPTGPYYENLARVIKERCDGKVLAIVSNGYPRSEECRFLTLYAQQLDPAAQKSSIIPLYIDKNVQDVPAILAGLHKIQYNQAYKNNFLRKKITSALTGNHDDGDEIGW